MSVTGTKDHEGLYFIFWKGVRLQLTATIARGAAAIGHLGLVCGEEHGCSCCCC